jgi:hypothetical protein
MQTQTEQERATGTETRMTRLFVRQPRSPLNRIAFWTFLVGTIASLGGTIAITLTSGAPSRDIVTSLVCSLLCTILIASRVRWMQAIATVIGAYLVYLIITEPFVVESLTNPKGPHGGLGAFIGEVMVAANIIIAFAASIGITIQNYRGGGRHYPRWFTLFLSVTVGLVIGASFIGVLARPVALASGVTYTNGVPTIHLSAGGFDVSSATIAKGSKLLLIDDTTSQHVLVNGSWQNNTPLLKREAGAPLVKNLSLSGNSVTIGPFAVAGTYHILCLIHHGMNLTVTVQ